MQRIATYLLLTSALAIAACGDDDTTKNNGDANATTNNATTNNATSNNATTNNSSANGTTNNGGMEDPFAPERLFELGDYEVGYREVEFEYTPTGSTEVRTIPVKIWYPAAPESGADGARYAVGGIVNVPTEIALASPPPASDGPFPVAVYSHGFGGEGLLAYPFGEFFASHGWVTVSPNHVGNTALDALNDSLIPFAQVVLWRHEDIVNLLDATAEGFGEDDLGAIADMERVLMYGHSFGAYTTLAVGGADVDFSRMQATCQAQNDQASCDFLAQAEVEAAFTAGFGDDRIDAIVPQAPAAVDLFGTNQLADGINVPTMIQTGDIDATTTLEGQSQPAWLSIDGMDDVWVRMPMGGHYSFITICDDLPEALLLQFRPDANDDGCGENFIPTSEAVPVLNAYLFAFGEAHVLGVQEWISVIEGMPLNAGFTIETK